MKMLTHLLVIAKKTPKDSFRLVAGWKTPWPQAKARITDFESTLTKAGVVDDHAVSVYAGTFDGKVAEAILPVCGRVSNAH